MEGSMEGNTKGSMDEDMEGDMEGNIVIVLRCWYLLHKTLYFFFGP